MQLNATDDGQKPVTFGVNEIGSFLDSQVKCVPVHCVTVGRRLLESLLYEIAPNLEQMFRTAPYHGVL